MRAACVAIALSAIACGDLQHENPFDPNTPLALQAHATLAGDVTLEAASGATPSLSGIQVAVPGTGLQAITDSAGHFEIAQVPHGTWTVQAVKQGYVDALVTGVTITLDDGNSTVTVPSLRLAVARGDVLGRVALQLDALASSFEQNASGVTVTLSDHPGAQQTDPAGTYAFAGVPVGIYALTASKTGFKANSIDIVQVTQDGVTTLAQLVLPPDPGGILGSVLVTGAADSFGVTVRASGTTLSGTPAQITTTTAASGNYLLSPIPAGSYNVTFEKQDYAVVATATAVVPGTVTDLPGVNLSRDTGSVIGSATLQGAGDSSGIQVSFTIPGTSTVVAAAITDSAGSWRADGVAVGTYTLAFRKQPGYLDQAGTVLVVSHQVVGALPATLPAVPGVVKGRVLLEGAGAAGNAGVTVRLEGTTVQTVTLADGSFLLDGVGAGAQMVVMERTGFDSQRIQAVVGPGETITLFDVTLAASRGSAGGSVTASGDASQAGTVVTVSGGPDSASTITNAAGSWRIDGLRVGSSYTAAFSRTAYASQTSAAFTVASAATTTVPSATLALDITGRISGVARYERPTAGPHAGITVSLNGLNVNGAAVTAATSTAADGSYQLTGLPQGTYSLTYARTNYDSQAQAGLFVAAGAQVTAGAVVLPVARGVVAGTVTLTAGSVAGFAVGTDFSGAVVALSGTDVPVPSVVTDATGGYRFLDVPVSLSGASFTVAASKAFFTGASTTVVAAPGATVSASGLTLPVAYGTLSGTTLLRDNVAGLGDNATHAGVTVGLSGTAFNGVGFSTSTGSASSGAWASGALPPGTFDVSATSAGRTCGAYSRTALPGSGAVGLGTVRCLDAQAPSALALGAPVPSAGADPGYTAGTTVVVPITTAATDPTTPASNFRGYQVVLGGSPNWSAAALVAGQPGSLTFTGLVAGGRNVLWARAIDWLDNAGTATSTEVIVDQVAPPRPAITTPRAIVDATTTSVTLSGSESDATFEGYEACSVDVGPTAACVAAAPGGCAWAAVAPSFALSLTASQKTCLYARARDHAGNVSPEAADSVVSDMVPPVPPTVAPLYDPTIYVADADYVDFFVTGAATDAPAGTGPWSNVAWVEVDTGAGFTPLCASASCRPGNVYSPCAAACSCADARLLCRGSEFAGVRVPLLGGTANRFSIRAVDVAGNVGSGATQQVNTGSPTVLVSSTFYDEAVPRIRGGLLTLTGNPVAGTGSFTSRLIVLGNDLRFQWWDATCDLDVPYYSTTYPSAEAISPSAVVHVGGSGRYLKVRHPGGGGFCSSDATTTLVDVGVSSVIWSAAGSLDGAGVKERAAWIEGPYLGPFSVKVREPGANNLLDLAGDDTNVTVATVAATNYAKEVFLGGNVLLYHFNTGGYTVVTATSGSFAGALSSWSLPAGALAAALDTTGTFLAWVANDPAQTVHIRTAGADGRFGTADDVEVTRTFPGPALGSAGIAIEAGHAVVTEASGLATYFVDHWYAGGDGTYGTADDTAARVLPGSRGRLYPALAGGIAAGTAYFQVGQTNTTGENADLQATDLAARRWEVASDQALSMPRPNGLGTLFYRDGNGWLLARSSDGRERRSGYNSGTYAADRTAAYIGSGSNLYLSRPDSNGLWFSAAAPADTIISTKMASGLIEANDGYVVAEMNDPVAGSTSLLRNVAGTWTATRLDNLVAGTTAFSYIGMGVSASHVAWGCRDASFTERACVRSAGVDGILGTADDTAAAILLRPGTATAYTYVRALRVWGNRLMVMSYVGPSNHLFIVDAGADKRFNTADDVEIDLGAVTENGNDPYDFRGPMVAWSAVVGSSGGTQVFLHDLRNGTERQLTTHYSFKPNVRVEPSGRVYWSDTLLQARAIFVNAP
jgi:Carboxypeptidase regulatory-like domain